MSKLIISNDTMLDILPYFAEMGEKLEKELAVAFATKGYLPVVVAIFKNIKKIKPELYAIIAEVSGRTVDEAKAMNIIATVALFKQVLSNEGIKETINFMQGLSSEGTKD